MPCRSEGHSPSSDRFQCEITPNDPFLNHNCRDAMPRVFSPTGFHLILPTIPVFESGFTGFLGLQRTSLV